MAAGCEDTGQSWRDPWPQHNEGCRDTDSSRQGPDTATLEAQTRPQRTGPSWVRIFVGGLVDGVKQTLRVTLGRFRAETTRKENR